MAETTIPGIGCRVVPHSCENEAISAPSWGLAVWLGLSLAIILLGHSKRIGGQDPYSITLQSSNTPYDSQKYSFYDFYVIHSLSVHQFYQTYEKLGNT